MLSFAKKFFWIIGLVLMIAFGFVFSSINVKAVTYTEGQNFRYLGCNQSKGTCTGYAQGITGNPTEMCGLGWKPVCGYGPDGLLTGGAPDLCSCAKTDINEAPKTAPQTKPQVPQTNTKVVYTEGQNFRYLGCNQSKGTCTGYAQGITGNPTEMCGLGWKPVCGYGPDGLLVSGAPDLCSCAKTGTNEVQPPLNTGCSCKKNKDTGKYEVITSNCSSLLPAQCHDGGFLYSGPDCDCLAPGAIQEIPKGGFGGAKTNAFCTNFGPGTTNPQIYTAFGCVPIETGKFMEWLLPYIFGVAGGIAFLLMVYGFILMTFSGGDPKKVQGAKETVTSAIVGLLISVFALFILRLITTDILKIPGIN